MIDQETGHSKKQLFDEQSTLMDWCQDLLDDFSSKPADAPLPPQDPWKLKETSSYGKSSCVLPITFFDIQSNIQFLNQCNPLSIQVVDCDKHPWYYKKYIRPYTPGKAVEDMDDAREPTNKPVVQLADVNAIKCIDLTENTCNSLTNNNSDAVNNATNLNKVVTNENKMSSITNTKKKKLHRLSNVTRDDLEKLIARSKMNLSKIDLKHNTGLVGLKIVPGIGFNNNLVSAKTKNNTKPLLSKTENNEVDECLSAASKTLSLFGTIIVPVNNQVQCKNFDKDDLPKNTYDCKVPSQSFVQVTVSKPESQITNTQTHIKIKDASFQVSNDNIKKHSKVKLNSSTQALGKKTNKHGKGKKATETLKSNLKKIKPADPPCTYDNNKELSCQIQENQNKRTTEDTSRSKSPIFPCNSKQKMQSELEKQLILNVEAHVEPSKNTKAPEAPKSNDLGQDNMVIIKNWPKSAYKYYQTPPSTSKTLDVSANKISSTISDNFNWAQSQQTVSIKNSTENYYKNTNISQQIQDKDNTMHTEPNKQVTPMITPTMTSIKMPKSGTQCKEPSILNLHTDQARRNDFNKNTMKTSAKNIHIEILSKKTSSNNNSIQNNSNSRDKNLDVLYQQFFGNINKNEHPAKLSDKPEKKSKTPLSKTRPPDQTVAIDMSLPIQNHISSRPESTKAYPGIISGVVKSQNIGACLVKQQTNVSNRPESNGEYPGRIPSVAASQNISASLLKQPIPGTIPAYCKVNGFSNNFSCHPNVHGANANRDPMNLGNANTEWDLRLHFPVPPFMHPPPLFLPPPPLPPSLEKLHSLINSIQNRAEIIEVIKNDANNLKDNKCTVNTKIGKDSSHNMRFKTTVEPSNLKFDHQNKSRAEETKKSKQIIITPSQKPYLPPSTNKTDALQIQEEKTTIVREKGFKNKLLEKDNKSHNSNISILHDITITPVTKSAVNTIHSNINNIPDNNMNLSKKQNDRTFVKKRNYDRSSSLHSGNNNKVLQIDKNKKKPKPGPLCMKNRTGPFAIKNAAAPAGLKQPTLPVHSEPKKGYSPPILPIPTFQTVLAQKHDLHVSMLTNPHVCQPSLYRSAQNRIPNNNAGDKCSRKRLHFEKKNASEVKKIKKISLEDYQNRFSGMDKGVGLVNDPTGMPGRKYARKSEKSFKSAKSLADVVNQGLDHEL